MEPSCRFSWLACTSEEDLSGLAIGLAISFECRKLALYVERPSYMTPGVSKPATPDSGSPSLCSLRYWLADTEEFTLHWIFWAIGYSSQTRTYHNQLCLQVWKKAPTPTLYGQDTFTNLSSIQCSTRSIALLQQLRSNMDLNMHCGQWFSRRNQMAFQKVLAAKHRCYIAPSPTRTPRASAPPSKWFAVAIAY